ncbi:Prophage side tail fiber protein-like protein StfR [Frankliniella fusca]|uniref:Prophage side tail fiber protein-like protein StfR n=1 Tax=Frankliniella fusca TaxID=407009 RepID=A0AAE1LN12_9NEOP|nr:Prophage side tail fiber protein-like protein StfR [Frankliniella fusca]
MLRAESAFLTGQKNPSFELIAAKVAYAFKPPGRNTNISTRKWFASDFVMAPAGCWARFIVIPTFFGLDNLLRSESAFLTGQKNPSFELIAAEVAYAFKPPGRNTNISTKKWFASDFVMAPAGCWARFIVIPTFFGLDNLLRSESAFLTGQKNPSFELIAAEVAYAFKPPGRNTNISTKKWFASDFVMAPAGCWARFIVIPTFFGLDNLLRSESAFLTGQKNPSFELIAAEVAYAFKPPGRNTNISTKKWFASDFVMAPAGCWARFIVIPTFFGLDNLLRSESAFLTGQKNPSFELIAAEVAYAFKPPGRNTNISTRKWFASVFVMAPAGCWARFIVIPTFFGLDNLLRAESAFLTGHWQKDPSFELRAAHQAIWIKQISGANKG